MKIWLCNVREGKTEVVNENSLVKSYDGIIGVKAWHTEKSGYSIAVSARRDGNSFTAVVMGCEDKDIRFIAAKQLLKDGFSGYRTVIPGFSSEYMKPLKVKGGTEMSVLTRAEEHPVLVIPKGSEGKMSTVVVEPLFVKAPVKKGQRVGTVAFYLEKTLLHETDLIADGDVEKNSFCKSLKKIIVKMFK
jgi:D-alanyl-D-alanine carboxypeptidase (penicillin-binding protein 5/6)